MNRAQDLQNDWEFALSLKNEDGGKVFSTPQLPYAVHCNFVSEHDKKVFASDQETTSAAAELIEALDEESLFVVGNFISEASFRSMFRERMTTTEYYELKKDGFLENYIEDAILKLIQQHRK